MSINRPTESELKDRINNHLNWRARSDVVALLWRGYLAGLLEWGAIEINVYDRLVALLPVIGVKETHELFADEPLSAERERELDEYLANLKE